MTAGFGDTVRIIDTPETEAAGIAGRTGTVFGFTTPSITDVNVIGGAAEDFALNVNIEDINDELWINPDLVEFIDHGAGQTFSLEGVEKEWVRSASGEWIERDLGGSESELKGNPKTTIQRFGLGVAVLGIPTGLYTFFSTAIPSFQESIRSGGNLSLSFNDQLLMFAPIVLGIIGLNIYLSRR